MSFPINSVILVGQPNALYIYVTLWYYTFYVHACKCKYVCTYRIFFSFDSSDFIKFTGNAVSAIR